MSICLHFPALCYECRVPFRVLEAQLTPTVKWWMAAEFGLETFSLHYVRTVNISRCPRCLAKLGNLSSSRRIQDPQGVDDRPFLMGYLPLAYTAQTNSPALDLTRSNAGGDVSV